MKTLTFVLAATILMVPAAANARTATASAPKDSYWRIPSTLGGAMVGAGVGWGFDIARWSGGNCGFCGPTLAATQLGIVAGGALGFIVGQSADRTLQRGDSLETAHRRWLRFAAFLTPAALGSTAAFLIINGDEEYRCVPTTSGCMWEEPKKIADDETVALIGIGGGVLLGWLLQEKTKGALRPHVTASTGALGLSFRHTF